MNPYQAAAQAGAGLLGGFFGARRAGAGIKQAGTTLANAYDQAARDAWQIPGMVNPGIARAYGTAGEDVYNQAYGSAANIEDRAAQARAGMDAAVNRGMGYFDPYATGGQQAFQSLSELAGTPALSREELTYKPGQLEMDPGYQFRLAEGQKALERSAAAKGILQTTGTLKNLAGYSQGLASQEYGAAYERGRREFADSFDRMMRGQTERRQTLSSLAGYGLQAGQSAAELGFRGAGYSGDVGMRATTQAGNWLNEAARYKGNAGIESERLQAGNVVNAANAGIDYGLRRAGATAGSQNALGNLWGNFYGSAGQSLGDLVGMYDWGGGGGGVGGYGMGSGGISPADIYYGKYPYGG